MYKEALSERQSNYGVILEHKAELTPPRDMQVLESWSIVKFKRVHVIGEEIILSDQSNGTISGMRPRGGISRRRDAGATPSLNLNAFLKWLKWFKNQLGKEGLG